MLSVAATYVFTMVLPYIKIGDVGSIAFVEGNYFFVKQPWFLGIILPWCAVYLWKKYKVVVVKTQCSQDSNAVKRS